MMGNQRIKGILLLLFVSGVYLFSQDILAFFFLLLLLLTPLLSWLLLGLWGGGAQLVLQAPALLATNGNRAGTVSLAGGKTWGMAPRLSCHLQAVNGLTGAVCQKELAAAAIKPGEEIPFVLEQVTTGKLELTVQQGRLLDFFGIFAKKLPCPPSQSCLVYPRTIPVILGSLPYSQTVEDSMLYSQYQPGRDVTEIFALHDYAPGDDLRRIHWKLSAKTDQLQVRDFALPLNHSVVILLELSLPQTAPADLSAAVDVAVSLSAALVHQGIRHTLAWYDAESDAFLMEEIADMNDFTDTLPALLSAKAALEGSSALLYYQQSPLAANATHLYYVATAPEAEPLCQLAAASSLSLIYVNGEKTAPPAGLPCPVTVTDGKETLVLEA